ncbi:hypothetical protein EYZ11_007215 [Aspergillus tanneri]|uniref:Tat pathway signal sequence n=1 Tax=Aspergillus tanneri TaxID=1220188 RepID=A0A4S3JDR5_9EURO|nr:uncharacterized protein ATNIH1004_011397 [Aspergillus tanneri]KAA8642453.1 hypothetical protein ATNIH1004_011397 [Aspergillus tanneri]THC93290.1 hypothetical protein EYZ11_007215 [Aspergillus tanneri]
MGQTPPSDEMEVNDKLLSDEEARWRYDRNAQSSVREKYGTIFLLIATAIISCGIGAVVSHQQKDSEKACTLRVSQYSPVISNVGIAYHQVQFNGSFLNENVYRKDAGPEVDAAWEALGANYRSIRVPPEEAERSGLAKDQVKINEKYGGGYPANVEGLHHLHCLNLLRQSLYYNYDYYHKQGKGAFTNDDYIVRRHVSHCLDILRQQLMCSIDIGVLGQVWVHPDNPEPFVDFNTKHQCRNFDAIRNWAEKNQLPESVPSDFLEPPNKGDRVFEAVP